MKTDVVIETERLRLRALTMNDYDGMVEIMSERDVTRFLLFFGYPINPNQVKTWLTTVTSPEENGMIFWAINSKEDDRLLGTIFLTIDNFNRKAEVGYWLAKSHWGRGLMPEAVWAVAQYVFETLKLHRLELTLMEENIGSRRVAEKVGFQWEGTWREGHQKDNTFRDVRIYGMLRVDFDRTRKRLEERK